MDSSEAALAARRGAGLAVLENGVLQLTGSERLAFLDGLVTNDVKVLRPGHSCYAAVLDGRGHVLGDLTVHDVGEGYLLDIPARQRDRLPGILRAARVSEDIALLDRSSEFRRLVLLGTEAPQVFSKVFGTPPDLWRWVEVPGGIAARTDPLVLPGYDFLVDANDAAVEPRLREAGTVAVDADGWEVLRLEAGRPEIGVDVDERFLAQEARLERAISFTKGCYVGQEVVARFDRKGHLRRCVVPLTVDSPQAPAVGAEVRREGKSVGVVTSAVVSRVLGKALAVATVAAGSEGPGTVLEIDGSEGPARAVVVEPPAVP